MSLTLALIPVSNEIFMTSINSMWVLALGLIIIFGHPFPQTRTMKIVDGSMVFIIGLSGPFIIPLLPMVALSFYVARKKGGHNKLPMAVYLIAFATAALQFIALASTSFFRPPGGDQTETFIFTALKVFCTQFSFPLANKYALTLVDSLDKSLQLPMLLVLSLAISSFLLYVVFRTLRNVGDNPFAFVSIASCLLIFLSYVVHQKDSLGTLTLGNSGRYLYVPAVALVWSVLTMKRMSGLRLAAFLCLYAVFSFNVYKFVGPTGMPDFGWKNSARMAANKNFVIIATNPYFRGIYVFYNPYDPSQILDWKRGTPEWFVIINKNFRKQFRSMPVLTQIFTPLPKGGHSPWLNP